ncbi:hypothetical protein MKZ38_004534 [Zalerion maritima]|uniref:Uncharacterized protein n=1 Tax=Zalerion maritima TaxID=339359 RepID=A0AAD5RLV6_9PEZI|nr:hypothetical protein MKZ38_004534 [Zalerion maritima]
MQFLALLTLFLPLIAALPAPQEEGEGEGEENKTIATLEPTATLISSITPSPDTTDTTDTTPIPTRTGCGITAHECDPYDPFSCGTRATCERFNPLDEPSPRNFGKFYCVCQAGYRAERTPLWKTWKQHRMTWVNERGDQTHRVFVRPGMECTKLCYESWDDPRDCDEVPLRDDCR